MPPRSISLRPGPIHQGRTSPNVNLVGSGLDIARDHLVSRMGCTRTPRLGVRPSFRVLKCALGSRGTRESNSASAGWHHAVLRTTTVPGNFGDGNERHRSSRHRLPPVRNCSGGLGAGAEPVTRR